MQNTSAQNKLTCGYAYRILANICASHSRKQEEIDFLFKSHAAFKEAGSAKQEAEALRLIGHYYFYMKLSTEASQYLTKAYKMALQLQDTLTQIKTISNLAQLAAFNKQFSVSIRLYNEAIQMSQSIHFKKGLSENWNRISYAYQKMGQPKKMLGAMRHAMRFAGNNKDTLGILYGDLGFAFMENGDYDSADHFLEKGLQHLNEGHNTIQRFLLTKFLATLRQRQQRYSDAIELLSRYDSLRTLVFTEQLKGEVSYVEARYNGLAVEARLQESLTQEKRLNVIAGVSVLLVLILIFIVIWLRRAMHYGKKQKLELDIALSSLTESEQFLRQLFENSPSLIFTHTLEGEILSFNRVVDETLGVKIGRKHLLDVISPSYHKQFVSFMENLREKGESSGWLRASDVTGIHRVFRYKSKVVKALDGSPYAITFALDDSEVFKARLEVELERQRLLSVMENSPDVFAIFKEDGTISFINHPDFFDGNDSTGKNVFQYLPLELADHIRTYLTQVFTSQKAVEFEETFKGRLYFSKLLPIISNGGVTEVLGIGTDITEKRNREDREKELNLIIEKNEKRYRSLVEASQVLICSHDLNGYLMTVNLPGANSIGYGREELVGRRLDEFIPEEYRHEFLRYLEVIKERGFFEGFLTVRKKDGSKRIFLFRNVLLKEEAMVLGSAQDVTEWRNAEYREKQIKKELQIAKDEAEESNRLKTIFLGSLSHEVRTPLQGILGFAEILDSSDITETKRKEYLNIIKRRTYDMQNVIESLLDIASVETGEITAVPVEMNIYEYAEIVFSKTRQDYPSLKNVEFILENKLSPHAMAFVDPQHLNQVLINLLRNAVKFTNEGTIKLTFERCTTGYSICVTDTGIGIANEKLLQIFKPFRQAHEGISRSKGGIGLGLAISKKMVELWKGKISVVSELGKGSIFTITIPTSWHYSDKTLRVAFP